MSQLNVQISDDVRKDLLDEARDWSNESGVKHSQAEVVAAGIRRLREERRRRQAGADLAASGGAGLVERLMRERTEDLAHQIIGQGASTNLSSLDSSLSQLSETLTRHETQHSELTERLKTLRSLLTFLASRLYINEVL